jgi:hypothetical protein
MKPKNEEAELFEAGTPNAKTCFLTSLTPAGEAHIRFSGHFKKAIGRSGM